jgi:hypothetical protein
MSVEPEAVIATLSLVLSTALAIFYFRDRRHARFSIENSYTNELLQWHKEVIGVLVRVRCLDHSSETEEHRRDICQLSSLIEQGRFFFPNIDKGDSFGEHKPPAYCGYRNLALDFLVAFYNLCKTNPSIERDKQLELLQRHFTSVVFDIVRPKERLNTIRALTDRYFVREESFEKFLTHQDGKVIEHIWITRNDN